jgi:hypothetical protein
MHTATELLAAFPAALQAMQDNPLGCLVLVTLGAFSLLAYAIHKLR